MAALLLCSVAFARAPSTQTTTERMAVQQVPSIVSQARMIGRHISSSPIHILVSLKLRHTAQLNAFLRAVHNPTSPKYHHFLAPAQFTALYGPTRTQVRAVTRYLRSQGLQVHSVASNRLLIRASGSTTRLEHAFSTQINDYSLRGKQFFAPAVRPKVPVTLVGTVQSIIGLNNAAKLQPHFRRAHIIHETGMATSGSHVGAHRIDGSSHATANSTPSGFSPLQIATAYNWPSITNTANANGVTIAIAQSTNLAASDYDGFWNQYGLPTHTVQMINVDGSAAATSGTGETTIDVERSEAMAPGATLVVYDANNSSLTDFTDTYNQIVTDNTAQVMTTSWGTAESNMSSAPSRLMTTSSSRPRPRAFQSLPQPAIMAQWTAPQTPIRLIILLQIPTCWLQVVPIWCSPQATQFPMKPHGPMAGVPKVPYSASQLGKPEPVYPRITSATRPICP